MRRALNDAGIPFEHREAARITPRECEDADFIFYMDEWNLRNLSRIAPGPYRNCHPITEFTPDLSEIEDPWYTHRYALVVEQIRRCVTDILDQLR